MTFGTEVASAEASDLLAFLDLDRGQQAVGVANAADLRPHRASRLQVAATAIHQRRTQHLWQVEITRPDDGKLVARGQVRLHNVDADG